MMRLITIMFMLIAAAHLVSAMKIGIVIDNPTGMLFDCVDLARGASAKEALDASKFQAEYSYGGGFIDSIDDLSNDFGNSKSWWFYHCYMDECELSNIGIKEYRINKENSFIVLGYYSYDENYEPLSELPELSFYDACPSAANRLELHNVKIELENHTLYDVNDSLIPVIPNESLKLIVKLENVVYGNCGVPVNGNIEFRFDKVRKKQEFNINVDSGERYSLEFKIPELSPGNYRAMLYIEGADKYETYNFERDIYFHVVKPTEITSNVVLATTTTVAKEQKEHQDETESKKVIVVKPQSFTPIAVIIALGILVFILVVAVFVILLK